MLGVLVQARLYCAADSPVRAALVTTMRASRLRTPVVFFRPPSPEQTNKTMNNEAQGKDGGIFVLALVSLGTKAEYASCVCDSEVISTFTGHP